MSSDGSPEDGSNDSSGKGDLNPQAKSFMPTPMAPITEIRHALGVLRTAFASEAVADTAVMLHCLGLSQITIPDTERLAQELSRHIIVISIDTEAWTNNGDEMTEVGMANFSLQDMRAVADGGNIGDYGEFLMQRIKFYFFRIREHAHQKANKPDMRGAEGNRFGEGRFVTFPEIHEILHQCFTVLIPGMEGCHCPVIVLGHAIGHDKENLNKEPLKFDVEATGNVIRYIDSQKISRETGMSDACRLGRGNEVGLERLVTALKFQHSDAHTACNDIARSVMCAIQLVLLHLDKDPANRNKVKTKKCKTMQQVADDLEAYSRKNFQSIGGVAKYCWRCGNVGHMIDECRMLVQCKKCFNDGRPPMHTKSHTTMHCPLAAQERGDERRRLHAIEKGRRRAEKAAATRGNYSRRGRGYFSVSNRELPPPSLRGHDRGINTTPQSRMINFPSDTLPPTVPQRSMARQLPPQTCSYVPYANQRSPQAPSDGHAPLFPGYCSNIGATPPTTPRDLIPMTKSWRGYVNSSPLSPQQRLNSGHVPQGCLSSGMDNRHTIGGNPSGRGRFTNGTPTGGNGNRMHNFGGGRSRGGTDGLGRGGRDGF